MGPTASATVLSNLYQISTFTELHITLETYSFDLNTFVRPSVQPNSTYNKPNLKKMWQVVTAASETILSNLYQISTFTEFHLILETYSFDLSTLWSTSVQLKSTHNRPKSRNWDKCLLRPQRLSWAICTRYLLLLSSRLLSRLTVFTWIPSYEARSNQTVLTTGQIRKNCVKWVLRPQRLSWAVCTRYLLLLSCRLLSRLTALTRISSEHIGPITQYSQ